jgi:hypothetical protein
MTHQTMTVGPLKVSYPAFLVLLAGVIGAVITLFMPYGVFVSIYLIIFASIASYTVNCTLVGNCTIWAWCLVVLDIIVIITAISRASMMGLKK